MVPFTRYRVRVGPSGLAMHVMETGPSDGRPVLCVHGTPTWGFLYRKVASELAGEPLRVIMPDLVGLGLSDRVPAEAHSVEAHAGWLAGLLEVMGLDDIVLVVQDWGGAIGVLAAEGRTGGLVVLNTTLSPPKPGFRPTAFHRLARVPVLAPVVFDYLGLTQRLMRVVQGDPGSIRGDVARAYVHPLRDRLGRRSPRALARIVPNSLEHPSIEALARCREVVEAFDGPAAIVWGDRDPVLGSVRSWISKLLPQAEVTRTEAGHFLQEEVPGEIAAAVRRVAAASGTSAGPADHR
jgi:haloalkane dehalogenase